MWNVEALERMRDEQIRNAEYLETHRYVLTCNGVDESRQAAERWRRYAAELDEIIASLKDQPSSLERS